MRITTVLVIGGYGFFGSRLVRLLARQSNLRIQVGGRSLKRAIQLIQSVPCAVQTRLEAQVVDVDAPDFRQVLERCSPDIVVHASGPFQEQEMTVARACIQNRCHYLDLADGRAFVQGISALDAEAKRAGVVVLSGASSVPALSSAAADWLSETFSDVRTIDIGISPGNKTERGLATVRSILSYVGKDLPNGDVAWYRSWQKRYPEPVGNRLLSPCDVPDLAVLKGRYPGRCVVRFGAGLEVRWLHRALQVLSRGVYSGRLQQISRHAELLKRASDLFRWQGSDTGAMHVTLTGQDRRGQPHCRTWTLSATKGDGPYVPTLAAAALVRRLSSGASFVAGARPCVGELTLEDFAYEAAGLSIFLDGPAASSLISRCMREDFAELWPVLQRFHRMRRPEQFFGHISVQEPSSRGAKVLAFTVGLPVKGYHGPLVFQLEANSHEERWTRELGDHLFTSCFHVEQKASAVHLVEQIGPAQVTLCPRREGQGIAFELVGFKFLGLNIPKFLWPRLQAREWVKSGEENSKFQFEVVISVLGLGEVVRYTGWLELTPSPGDLPYSRYRT